MSKTLSEILVMLEDKENVELCTEMAKNLTEDDMHNIIFSGGKSTWLNTIYVFQQLGYEKYKPAIFSMFELLQDTSWPGSYEARLLLQQLEPIQYIDELSSAIKEAFETNDEEWMRGIACFMDGIPLSQYLNGELFQQFKEKYERYCELYDGVLYELI